MTQRIRRTLTLVISTLLFASFLVVTAAQIPQARADYDNWVAEGPNYMYSQEAGGVRYRSPQGEFFVSKHYTERYSYGSYDFDSAHRAFGGGRGLGYPTSDVISDPKYGRVYQRFERGIIYGSMWTADNSSDQGTMAVVKTGGNAFGRIHAEVGGGSGTALGYPIRNEVAQSPGYWYQSFENGTIYVSPRGAYAVTYTWGAGYGGIQREHLDQGGGAGLGYPTSREVVESPGYSYQAFERGVIYKKNDCCAATVKGGFLPYYLSVGSGRGWLGYPIGNEYHQGGYGVEWMQSFERGWIFINNRSQISTMAG